MSKDFRITEDTEYLKNLLIDLSSSIEKIRRGIHWRHGRRGKASFNLSVLHV